MTRDRWTTRRRRFVPNPTYILLFAVSFVVGWLVFRSVVIERIATLPEATDVALEADTLARPYLRTWKLIVYGRPESDINELQWRTLYPSATDIATVWTWFVSLE